MDFSAQAGSLTVGVGETGPFVPGDTTVRVPLPALHPASPQAGPASTFAIRLFRIGAGDVDDLVAEAVDGPLAFAAAEPGSYRAEIHVVPRHLTPWLGANPEALLGEAPWIVTNYLHLEEADRDGDAVPDGEDNCIEVPNPSQRDADGDGFGNPCDPDLNGDLVVNFADLARLAQDIGRIDAPGALATDFDENGVVNQADVDVARAYFYGPPGPSAFAP
jgi:hypothetical protein